MDRSSPWATTCPSIWLHAHVRARRHRRHDSRPGDIAILNDPYAGGTHLPDITMVLPVFAPGQTAPLLYVATRAHHADVGGFYPGSMGLCREIYQEGLRIPPVRSSKQASSTVPCCS